jgi:hypothetical protein
MNTLVNLYEQKSETISFQTQREFHDLQWKRGQNVLEYLSELRTVCNKLEILGVKMSEGVIIAKVLEQLPKPYQNLRDQWDMAFLGGVAPTFKDLEAQLFRLEQRYLQQKSTTELPERPKKYGTHDTKGRKNEAHHTQEKKIKCFNCGKIGHKAANCWSAKKHPQDKPQETKKKQERKDKNKPLTSKRNEDLAYTL